MGTSKAADNLRSVGKVGCVCPDSINCNPRELKPVFSDSSANVSPCSSLACRKRRPVSRIGFAPVELPRIDCRCTCSMPKVFSARARIHRRREREPRREGEGAFGPGDRHGAVLERLPQRLEHRARKFRQLVEEQDAPMREARLAGPRGGAAADEPLRRNRMMRGAERTPPDERAAVGEHSRRAVYLRHLERLVVVERRQYRA